MPCVSELHEVEQGVMGFGRVAQVVRDKAFPHGFVVIQATLLYYYAMLRTDYFILVVPISRVLSEVP
jgi:hypothetical protein